MAHVAKYTRGGIQGLSNHLDRKTSNHSNKDIDVSKTHLNYDLNQSPGDTLSRLNKRLDQVYCMNRKDVKPVADWIVTLPKELEDKTADEQKEFFKETKNFLDKQYGEENNISANVHMDETTPHMHYAFIPVVYDKKKEREKVSAKLVLTRNHLKTFHDELDKHLKAKIPHIYEHGVVNGQTVGVESVKELKQLKTQEKALNMEIEKLTQQRDDVTSQIQAKKGELSEIKFIDPEIETKPVAFQKSYVKVSKNDLHDLKTQASVSELYRSDAYRLELDVQALKRENWELKSKVKELTRKLETAIEPLKEKLSMANTLIKEFTREHWGKETSIDEIASDLNADEEQTVQKNQSKPNIDRDRGPSL